MPPGGATHRTARAVRPGESDEARERVGESGEAVSAVRAGSLMDL